MRYKYFYGQKDCDFYIHDDPYQAGADICEELEIDQVEIYEMKVSRGQDRWCKSHLEFFEPGEHSDCGMSCNDYKPRNGISGICEHLSYGLKHTGRILLIDKDFNLVKTISPRRRKK